MGEATGIAWTQKTWNPWQGCRKVSPGCKHCYMYSEKIRYGQKPDVVVRSKPPTFNAPLKWKERELVFTCSWSDFFIEEADAWRDEAWEIIRATPHLTYQILTKRPERIDACLPGGWPFRNVWLGVSAENQAALDERLPILLDTPAWLRFLSLEPLLGPVTLQPTIDAWAGQVARAAVEGRPLAPLPTRVGWAIVGGESGAGARPMEIAWARSLVLECRAAGLPCFVKQLGAVWARTPRSHEEYFLGAPDQKGGDPEEWPEDLRVREFPEVPRAL